MITNIRSYNTTSNPAPQINSSKPTQNINRKSYDECKFTNTSTADSLFENLINFTGSTIKKFSAPLVAIISNFDQKVIDIDGDNIPDLSHGDTISRIVKSFYPDIKIQELKIKNNKDGSFNMTEPILRLKELANAIDNEEKIDAVNISLGQEIEINTLRECTGLPLDRENLKDYKTQIRNWLKNPSIPFAPKAILDLQHPGKSDRLIQEFKVFNQAIEAIEQITNKGIPVYISAGNEGSEYFNILALAERSIPIGAQDSKGIKESFSADNSLINRFEQGIYNISPITDKNNLTTNYDLTGDNKPEVFSNEVSGGESKVKPYIGKQLNSVLAQEDDYSILIELLNKAEFIRKIKNRSPYDWTPQEAKSVKLINNVTNYDIGVAFDQNTIERKSSKVLFPINAVANLYKLSQQEVSELKAKGDYINASLSLIFKTDKDGKVLYDPDNSGRPAINCFYGTSFAAPKGMIIDTKTRNCTN